MHSFFFKFYLLNLFSPSSSRLFASAFFPPPRLLGLGFARLSDRSLRFLSPPPPPSGLLTIATRLRPHARNTKICSLHFSSRQSLYEPFQVPKVILHVWAVVAIRSHPSVLFSVFFHQQSKFVFAFDLQVRYPQSGNCQEISMDSSSSSTFSQKCHETIATGKSGNAVPFV